MRKRERGKEGEREGGQPVLHSKVREESSWFSFGRQRTLNCMRCINSLLSIGDSLGFSTSLCAYVCTYVCICVCVFTMHSPFKQIRFDGGSLLSGKRLVVTTSSRLVQRGGGEGMILKSIMDLNFREVGVALGDGTGGGTEAEGGGGGGVASDDVAVTVAVVMLGAAILMLPGEEEEEEEEEEMAAMLLLLLVVPIPVPPPCMEPGPSCPCPCAASTECCCRLCCSSIIFSASSHLWRTFRDTLK